MPLPGVPFPFSPPARTGHMQTPSPAGVHTARRGVPTQTGDRETRRDPGAAADGWTCSSGSREAPLAPDLSRQPPP